jgi:hypothetical protein
MATFHVIGKPDLTILVSDYGIVQLTENVFCVMFAFQRGSMHVSKNVFYMEENIVLSFTY